MATDILGAIGTMIGGFFLFVFLMWFLLFAIGITSLVFWIFMIVDVAKRNFKQENDKILWLLVVILAGAIGGLVYYFVIKRPDKH